MQTTVSLDLLQFNHCVFMHSNEATYVCIIYYITCAWCTEQLMMLVML